MFKPFDSILLVTTLSVAFNWFAVIVFEDVIPPLAVMRLLTVTYPLIVV